VTVVVQVTVPQRGGSTRVGSGVSWSNASRTGVDRCYEPTLLSIDNVVALVVVHESVEESPVLIDDAFAERVQVGPFVVVEEEPE